MVSGELTLLYFNQSLEGEDIRRIWKHKWRAICSLWAVMASLNCQLDLESPRRQATGYAYGDYLD